MSIQRTVALFLVFILAGCEQKPEISDASERLKTRIAQESGGLLKLVSFDKTDGVEQTFAGMKVYEMDYTAEIELLGDCSWGGDGPGGWDGRFSAQRGHPPTRGLAMFNLAAWRGKFSGNKGAHQKINGKMMFEKTEQGWRIAH